MPNPFPADPPARDDPTPARVLVVDDDPAVRNYVSLALRRAGYSAALAPGVDAALAAMADAEFDAALVDLDMPVRGGLELLSEIRTRGHTVVPVLLTGTADVGAAVEGMKRGAYDYLAKPVDPEAIRWATERAVAAARSRRREQALERVIGEWALTFDACTDAILVLDENGRILRANRAASERAGANAAELVGRAAGEAFGDVFGEGVTACRATLGQVRVSDPIRGEHFQLTARPIPLTGGTAGRIVIAQNVTGVVNAEMVRTRLLRQLLTAQEDERGRIARELHDGIGQVLVSIRVGLNTVAEAMSGHELSDQLRRVKEAANTAAVETRRMAHGLRPAVLDDLGLGAALTRLADDFSRLHAVRAELVVSGAAPHRYPAELESAVYRIVQEALANVARHAAAKTVDVVLEAADGVLLVSVSDDGVGFTPGSRARPEDDGIGLPGMRERASALGGVVNITSETGRGTTVDVRLPIPGGAT